MTSQLSKLTAAIHANVEKYEALLLSTTNKTPPHIWEPKLFDALDDPTSLPPMEIFQLMEKIRLDMSAVQAAITPNRYKILDLSFAQTKSTCLSCAATMGVADAIEELGGNVALPKLATYLDVNENKLGRVLRVLSAECFFKETAPDVFGNTRHSIGLLKKHGAAPFISLDAVENGIAATGMEKNLTDSITKHSFEPNMAPFCSTVAKNGEEFFTWIMQPEHGDTLEKVVNGVTPWLNKITRQTLLDDYPWHELGSAKVIDVGCGPGDSGFDIIAQTPTLRWEFQDLQPVIDQLKASIAPEFKAKVESGDITTAVQDYFQPNTSRGDIWYLRGVLREYDDEKALKLLRQLVEAMKHTPNSRMIINEALCSTPSYIPTSTTVTDNHIVVVPSEHVPEKQAVLTQTANLITWSTYNLFGGKERSYNEMEVLLNHAGLHITRFFQLRSLTVMFECKVKKG